MDYNSMSKEEILSSDATAAEFELLSVLLNAEREQQDGAPTASIADMRKELHEFCEE